jgi:hypothetical protein
VAAIFSPLLKVVVMTDINGGFMRVGKCERFLASSAADNDYEESKASSIPAQNQHLIVSTLDMSNRCRY